MTPDGLRDQQGRLDSLLSAQQMGQQLPRGAVDPQLLPLLEVASQLEAFGQETPSPEFANALETRLLARAARLSTAPAVTPMAPVTPQRFDARPTAPRHTSRWRATRMAWAAVAATFLLVVSLGAVTASAHPGTPFYPLRKTIQSVGVRITGDSAAATAQAHLQRANQELAAFDAATSRGDESAALAALAQLRQDDQQAAQAISQTVDDTQRQSLQQQLDDLHTHAIGDLRAALPNMSLPGRIQVTNALDAFGDTVLTITSASITSNGQGTGAASKATAVVIIKGSGFTAGATLFIDSRPLGVIDALTPSRIVAHVPMSALTDTPHQIGVSEPDGTAAATSHLGHGNDNGDSGATGSGDHTGDHTGSQSGENTTSGQEATTTSQMPESSPTPEATHTDH